jgi:hypothetical protein
MFRGARAQIGIIAYPGQFVLAGAHPSLLRRNLSMYGRTGLEGRAARPLSCAGIKVGASLNQADIVGASRPRLCVHRTLS